MKVKAKKVFKRISHNGFFTNLVKSFFSPLYFSLTFIYLEIVFHILETDNIPVFFPIVFAIPAGILFGFFADLFQEKIARPIRYILSILVMVIFGTQIVYNYVFQEYMSWSQSGMANDVFGNFLKTIIDAIFHCLPSIILIFLPLVVLYFLHKYLRPDNSFDWFHSISQVAVFAVIQFVVVLMLPLGGRGANTCYDLYHSNWLLSNSIRQLGVITTTKIDIKQLIFSSDDEDVDIGIVTVPTDFDDPSDETNNPIESGVSTGEDEPKVKTGNNIIDGLDFASLAASEKDKNVKKIFTYLDSLQPTEKNKYTGMFEGYNLVMICAESFSPVAVNKDLTPTLYKLSHEGFVFDNFWTLYPSNTTNGEYSFLTGLIPDLQKPKKDGSFLFTAKNGNTMNLTMASYFQAHGVTPYGFHAHIGSYYSRNITHPNLGYTFKGRDEINELIQKNNPGLEELTGWPESDLIMMQATVPQYVNDDRFLAYYMSVSGHHNYKFGGYNSIADKNKSLVSNSFNNIKSDYQEEARAYLACNIELDRALQSLIEQLKAAGKLEKTVICICPDHYPYGLSDKGYAAMLGHGLNYDGLERWKQTLILWNSEMGTINIDKPCCTVDVLPTLLNLFGFEYDSRLYSGQDIFSNSYGLAFTTEQSFVTNKLIYHARYKTKYKTDTSWEIPDGYIDTYTQIVRNRFDMAAYILDYDLYAKLPQDIIKASLAAGK